MILFLQGCPRDAATAAFLRAIGGVGDPLDVAAVTDGHDHLLLGDQVLDIEIAGERHDFTATIIAEAVAHVFELFHDQPVEFGSVRQ